MRCAGCAVCQRMRRQYRPESARDAPCTSRPLAPAPFVRVPAAARLPAAAYSTRPPGRSRHRIHAAAAAPARTARVLLVPAARTAAHPNPSQTSKHVKTRQPAASSASSRPREPPQRPHHISARHKRVQYHACILSIVSVRTFPRTTVLSKQKVEAGGELSAKHERPTQWSGDTSSSGWVGGME